MASPPPEPLTLADLQAGDVPIVDVTGLVGLLGEAASDTAVVGNSLRQRAAELRRLADDLDAHADSLIDVDVSVRQVHDVLDRGPRRR